MFDISEEFNSANLFEILTISVRLIRSVKSFLKEDFYKVV
jgi:hypothetical protein